MAKSSITAGITGRKVSDGEHYDPLAKYMTHVQKGPRRASYLKRVLAFIFDILFLELVVLWPFEAALSQVIPTQGFSNTLNYLSSNPSVYTTLSGIALIIGLIVLAYFVLMEYFLGRTVGKILFNIKVVKYEHPGLNKALNNNLEISPKKSMPSNDLGLLQCFTRNMFVIPAFPFVLFWFIDPAFLFFNPQGQRLTEFLSSTMVVDDEPVIAV